MNFGTLTSDVLDYINRPAGEMTTQVQREINNAIVWAQRKHEFKFTERLVEANYPGNTLLLNLTDVCDGYPRNYLNFQEIGSSGQSNGKLLEITSFHNIQRRRLEYQKKFPEPRDTAGSLENSEWSHEEFTRRDLLTKVCLVEKNISLYPVPTGDKLLLINLHVWLPTLVADEDTNFFFDYGYDFLIDKTVQRMSRYLKNDDRKQMVDSSVAESFDALLDWDGQIRTSIDAP